MASTTELIFKISAHGGNLKSTMAQVRAELAQTAQSTTTVNKGKLSMRQQLAAASSLQRQRSAALIGEFKRTETAAKQLASGIQPVSTNLQKITDVMQSLRGATATLQGPLGGVAGRLGSLGSLATTAGGGLGVMGVAAGAAVVGIGALAVGAVAAGVAIFKLTQQAAEFQGKMFDLSQQTGVSVETLSTLEIAATTTGGNIDNVAQSLFLFQRNLESAQDPTSKEAKLLKELGVQTENTEQSLRQSIAALAKMPEGFQQTNAAAELFGARGGKQVLAILKELDGDLDGAIDKFRKMGILISTDAAKAADKFNDQLAILGFQIRAITAVIGNEAMPTILAALEYISNAFTENKETIFAWAGAIADAARGVGVLVNVVATLVDKLQGFSRIPVPLILRALMLASGADRTFALLQELGDQGPFAGATGGAGAPRAKPKPIPIGGGGGGGGRSARDTALADATRDAALTEREALLINADDVNENKRALEEQARDIEDYTRRAIELNNLQLDATIDRITAESDALDIALAKRLITQTEYENKQRELDIQAAKAHQENKNDEFKLEQERDRKISEARIAAKKRELQIAEDADTREIKRIDDRIANYVISVSEGERQVAAILDAGFERRRKALVEEEDAYSTSLERRADINAEIIRLDGERAFSAEQAARRVIEAIKKENEEHQKALKETRGRTGDLQRESALIGIDLLISSFARRRDVVRAQLQLQTSDEAQRHQQELASIDNQRDENAASAATHQQKNERIIELNLQEEAEAERHRLEMQRIRDEGKRAEAEAGPAGGFLSGLETGQLTELKDGVQSFADVATVAFSAVGASVGQLAQGIGALVQNWVLMGSTGPNAFRKLAATILASVSSQAATLAIMSLAYAALATTAVGAILLGGTPIQFLKAAALFGVVAVGTGLAGRAVAGNSFNQPGGGGGTGERTGGPEERRPPPGVVDINRRGGIAAPPQTIILKVDVTRDEGSTVKALVDNYRSNGIVRNLILNEG